MNNTYTIFSLRIANALAKQGFEIVNTGINVKNPKYSVFYFKDSEELRTALDKLTKQ